MSHLTSQPSPDVVFAALPGPSRKRTTSPYCYRLTHREDDPMAVGCILAWDVMGGREVYQIALERTESGRTRFHCTCADAVYRGESRPGCCKHVAGLRGVGRRQGRNESAA